LEALVKLQERLGSAVEAIGRRMTLFEDSITRLKQQRQLKVNAF
jgi:hypothetical protein